MNSLSGLIRDRQLRSGVDRQKPLCPLVLIPLAIDLRVLPVFILIVPTSVRPPSGQPRILTTSTPDDDG